MALFATFWRNREQSPFAIDDDRLSFLPARSLIAITWGVGFVTGGVFSPDESSLGFTGKPKLDCGHGRRILLTNEPRTNFRRTSVLSTG